MKRHFLTILLLLFSGLAAPVAFTGCEVDVDPVDEGPLEDAIEEAADE
jgi:hypothetical protein